MTYCFDSSAVVKRYAAERGSAWVKNIVQPTAGNSVYLAQIGVVEIAAALSRKVRTNEIRREEYAAALGLFLADVRNAEFILIPVNDQIIELAVDLTGRHPLRGYDAVHLATAVTLHTALRDADASPPVFVAAMYDCVKRRAEKVSCRRPRMITNGEGTVDAVRERLIERGFPCHQVGAETQRERGMSTALPAHFALHVWWARRPLTPSRKRFCRRAKL